MDPITLVILFLTGTIFSKGIDYLVSDAQSDKQIGAQKELQENQQNFNAEEAAKGRNWQEEFYNKYQSPEAINRQFSELGASDNAALMAALGVSPSTVSSPTASSGLGSVALPGGVNGVAQLFQQLTQGLKNYSEKEGQDIDNSWKPRLNQVEIDCCLGNLKINQARLELETKTFEEVTKPFTFSCINKNSAEIAEIESRILKNDQEIDQIVQNIKNLKAQERLTNAQIDTEGFRQAELETQSIKNLAERDFLWSTTAGKNIENQLNGLTLDMSKAAGFDIRLDWKNVSAGKVGYLVGEGEQVISSGQFTKAITSGVDALDKALSSRKNLRKAFYLTKDYLNASYKGSYQRLKNLGKSFDGAEKVIKGYID